MPAKIPASDWLVNVPEALHQDRWVKYDKVKRPHQLANGRPASTTNPRTWASWEEARAAKIADDDVRLGFVFTPDCGVIFIDLDDCLDDQGDLKMWAFPFVEPLIGKTYCERSPSGTGLHFFLLGTPPPNAGTRSGYKKVIKFGGVEIGAAEIYWTRRYSTVTGDIWPRRLVMP